MPREPSERLVTFSFAIGVCLANLLFFHNALSLTGIPESYKLDYAALGQTKERQAARGS
jgi:hypothetical protein